MKDEAIRHIKDIIQYDRRYSYRYYYLSLINNPFYNNLLNDSRFKDIVEEQRLIYEERVEKYGSL